MEKTYLIIDIARCHGCNNCFMACKDEFCGNDFVPFSVSQPRHGQRWIDIIKRERGRYPMIDVAYLPLLCQHCENAACESAGGGAVERSPEGAVYFGTVSAREKKELAESCPFGAVWWNEKESLAQKCSLCAHLIKEGDSPGALRPVRRGPWNLYGWSLKGCPNI
jgi:Fe-S-cluster-containing dehydrogenase component